MERSKFSVLQGFLSFYFALDHACLYISGIKKAKE
jgi:hypothetical protein